MNYKKINIAIVGFGNIGSYFYKTLNKNKKNIALITGKMPSIKYISAKNISKKRRIKIPRSKWIKNPMLLVKKSDVDIIIELIGGSKGIAKKLDWHIIPYPVDYGMLKKFSWLPNFNILENLGSFQGSSHEWIGLIAYYLMGRTIAVYNI